MKLLFILLVVRRMAGYTQDAGKPTAQSCDATGSQSCDQKKPKDTTLLYLRYGGLLSTDKPSMDGVTKADWEHVAHVHSTTQYFHSDFAHTDYTVKSGSMASWSTPPLEQAVTLQGLRVSANLWIGTNASETDFTASLMHFPQANGGSPAGEAAAGARLCSATSNTRFREGKETGLLPGQPMMATGANGGYSVALPFELELAGAVTLQPGDVLRLDVSGSKSAEERVDHRVWHNPKWASTLEVELEPSSLELKWARPSSL